MAAFAEEESRNMRDNSKWTIKKKFERGEIMINTTRFLGYDLDEYGDLLINEEQADLVRRIFRMYLDGLGSFKIAKVLNNEGILTLTGQSWADSTIKGILTNEKYKGDYLLQKYFTPEGRRNQTILNRGEVQSYYISENHPAIISPEDWEKVQLRIKENAKKKGIDYENLEKYQNRYPLSGMLICPYCRRNLRRRYVHNKKVQWICSTYITKGKGSCKGIRIDDEWIKKQGITKPTVVEEIILNGCKRYRLTEKDLFEMLEKE
ncbi:recombinase family protein [Clostridium tyrobutyricum]|uniref:recombinase family protein n=1 Tax=Clostridium tyrobutyricum TaxID=1519 RepID=UPI0020CD8BDB|nr:recombinase family protein [Clostridium tyrobutyricum]